MKSGGGLVVHDLDNLLGVTSRSLLGLLLPKSRGVPGSVTSIRRADALLNQGGPASFQGFGLLVVGIYPRVASQILVRVILRHPPLQVQVALEEASSKLILSSLPALDRKSTRLNSSH